MNAAEYEQRCRHDANTFDAVMAGRKEAWDGSRTKEAFDAGVDTLKASQQEAVRKFETGATRSPDVGRYDPEGFFSPLVFECFCEYMQAHRLQTDGTLRDSDNWQKGLPKSTYMKGMWRHFLHLWKRHRGFRVNDSLAGKNVEEDLCALLFNVQGYLHEQLKQREHLVIESTQTASEPRRG